MSNEEVIEKIKKLLRMKRGGTAGEIENALAAAAKLAREHDIDLNSVNPDDEQKSETITHHEEVLKLRLPAEAKYALGICVNFFNVGMIHRHGIRHWLMKKPHSIIFCGTSLDIEIARYVFVFLQHHFRTNWKGRANRRLKNRDAFYHGMYLGLGYKLESEREKVVGVGLVRIGHALQQRNDYLTKHFPNAKEKNMSADRSGAHAAKYAGIIEGQKTNIRPGIEQPAAPVRAALPPAAGQMQLI